MTLPGPGEGPQGPKTAKTRRLDFFNALEVWVRPHDVVVGGGLGGLGKFRGGNGRRCGALETQASGTSIFSRAWAPRASGPLPRDQVLILGRSLTVPGPGSGLRWREVTKNRPHRSLRSAGCLGRGPRVAPRWPSGSPGKAPGGPAAQGPQASQEDGYQNGTSKNVDLENRGRDKKQRPQRS